MKKIAVIILALFCVISIAAPLSASRQPAAAKNTCATMKTPAKTISLESQEIIKINQDITVAEWDSVKKVVAIGGSVTVNGRVEEEVIAIGGSIKVNAGAEIGTDAVAIGGLVTKLGDAKISGDIIEIGNPLGGNAFQAFSKHTAVIMSLFMLVSALATLVLLVVIAALFPAQIEKMLAFIDRGLLQSLGWGLLAGLLIVPIILMFVISLIGIPLIPLFLLVLAAAYIMGLAATAAFLGRRILHSLRVKTAALPWEILAGGLVLILIGWVPWVGWLVKLLLVLCGCGAVVATRFGAR
ncbi:MAG: hypothetical protein WC901_03660 [Candidatus Margulisiibacteriota bacterium]